MSISLEPSGSKATHSFIVDNSGSEKIAVQISMAKRKVDAAGTETNPEADDDFIVYPSQLILEPKQKRTVRVTWAGDTKPASELAYRIIAEQLPVDTSKPKKKKQAMIRMLLRYLGAVYITPRGADAKIEVTEARSAQLKGKGTRLVLVLTNKGTAHQIIKAARLKLSAAEGSEKSVELKGESLKALAGLNLLAGASRRFELAWPDKLEAGPQGAPLKAELDIED